MEMATHLQVHVQTLVKSIPGGWFTLGGTTLAGLLIGKIFFGGGVHWRVRLLNPILQWMFKKGGLLSGKANFDRAAWRKLLGGTKALVAPSTDGEFRKPRNGGVPVATIDVEIPGFYPEHPVPIRIFVPQVITKMGVSCVYI